ncbi:hypothetical protein [Paenibacillus tundrae]|uniref:Type II secretory pathway component GspD/PulD (Secretin) n=1 Tax=Paenibacillus tundrae TaxID=528187 RepID=A0ABT9WDF5_9BACL|nr:hypothetical protein [Paenibacillus tundrae]MDQ0171155.1 type II secretory pathway component GspD/PulD (secretin) [Paenibacillus tundrae]
MKNKPFVFGVLIIVLIAGISYIIADQTIENTETISSSDHHIFADYEELAEHADLIVEVTATNESTQVIEDRSGRGHTVTRVAVNQVFANSTQQKLHDQLDILEPTYVMRNRGLYTGVTRYNYGHYTPMYADQRYVLFLTWDDKRQGYWVRSLEQGKFNVDHRDTEEQATRANNPQLQALKTNVLQHLAYLD